MNGLSWFLYLAEVVGELSTLASISSFLGIFGFLGVTFWWFIYQEEISRGRDCPKPPMKAFLWLWALSISLTVFVPSRETIYLIAGSQAGEAVVTSESGQEIINDIQEVIKHQLGELKKRGEK